MRRFTFQFVIPALLLLLSPHVTPAQNDSTLRPGEQLVPPDQGSIPVAFVLSQGATVIDFSGPWEVFQDVFVPGRDGMRVFNLYTVAETRDPIRASAGLQIVPDFAFEDAPAPKVIVVPATGSTPAMINWIRSASESADMTMSVCTGAFVLARAGLLDESRGWHRDRGMWDDSERGTSAVATDARPLPVLQGFDPVLLCAGREVTGSDTFSEQVGNYRHVFASENCRDSFIADPRQYLDS